MVGDYLKVQTGHDGPAAVLAVSGELDVVSTNRLLDAAAPAVAADYERFVLDLAGLTFTDCYGARALAALAATVPDECPVIVCSVQPAVRRVLDLTGITLERMPGKDRVPAEERAAGLIRDVHAARSDAQATRAETRRAARRFAETEDCVAVTMAIMAQRKPQEAERLLSLSGQARTRAERFRRLAVSH
jgi:anti-sigma B factor antagonist